MPEPKRKNVTKLTSALAGLAVAGLLAASPLGAQAYDGAIGYGGGGVWFGEFNEGGTSLALDDGWLASLQGEYYVWGGRSGLRLGAAFTQRPFQAPDGARDINTWLFDASVLFRPLPARPDRAGISPYLAVGGGLVNYDFGEGLPLTFPDAEAVYPGDNEMKWAAVGAVGIDLVPRLRFLDTPLGIRLEVADHVVIDSPFESFDGESFGPVHNVRVTLGLIGLVELL